jgi:hypothetical protein
MTHTWWKREAWLADHAGNPMTAAADPSTAQTQVR